MEGWKRFLKEGNEDIVKPAHSVVDGIRQLARTDIEELKDDAEISEKMKDFPPTDEEFWGDVIMSHVIYRHVQIVEKYPNDELYNNFHVLTQVAIDRAFKEVKDAWEEEPSKKIPFPFPSRAELSVAAEGFTEKTENQMEIRLFKRIQDEKEEYGARKNTLFIDGDR